MKRYVFRSKYQQVVQHLDHIRKRMRFGKKEAGPVIVGVSDVEM